VKCPSWFDSDLNNKKSKAGGYCIITDLSGDQAYLTWQGVGTPGPDGRLSGTFQYTGGTGKYRGISGDNTFVALFRNSRDLAKYATVSDFINQCRRCEFRASAAWVHCKNRRETAWRE
jgi:hypothetical protein